MHIYDLVDIYRGLVSGNHKDSLAIIQAAEDQGVKKMVECLVDQGFKKEEIQALCNKKCRGRKPEEVVNPVSKMMLDSFEDKDFMFKLDDAISGVCHSFENDTKAKRIKITKRKLSLVLKMPVITTDKVKDLLFVGDAQARRYIKAAKVLISVIKTG